METPSTSRQPRDRSVQARARRSPRHAVPVFRDGEEPRSGSTSSSGSADAITVGRRFEADISLPWDPEASRLHAELRCRAGEWTICDDGWSQNGTWVNGLRLVRPSPAAPTATWCRIGQTIIGFQQPRRDGPGPTMVPGELSSTPRFSEQQQRILRSLCAPLFGDGDGFEPVQRRRDRRRRPGSRRGRHRRSSTCSAAPVRADGHAAARAPRGDRPARAARRPRELTRRPRAARTDQAFPRAEHLHWRRRSDGPLLRANWRWSPPRAARTDRAARLPRSREPIRRRGRPRAGRPARRA